jgi:hypothetical protein
LRAILFSLLTSARRSEENMTAVLPNSPSTIDSEIAAYDSMKDELERNCFDKWVVIHSGRVAGVFEEFNLAAAEAVQRFGRGPYLIRRVGQKPTVLPASVVYSSARHGR